MDILLLLLFSRPINNHIDQRTSEWCAEKRDITMSNNWMTTAEAVTLISKNSHHPVNPSHVQMLVSRGKIGTRSFPGGRRLLKRSNVQATRLLLVSVMVTASQEENSFFHRFRIMGKASIWNTLPKEGSMLSFTRLLLVLVLFLDAFGYMTISYQRRETRERKETDPLLSSYRRSARRTFPQVSVHASIAFREAQKY